MKAIRGLVHLGYAFTYGGWNGANKIDLTLKGQVVFFEF